MNIVEALSQLDPTDDSQWTQDGLPLVEVVSGLVGQEVSRADITNAKPDFLRETATKAQEAQDNAESSTQGEESDQAQAEAQTDTEEVAVVGDQDAAPKAPQEGPLTTEAAPAVDVVEEPLTELESATRQRDELSLVMTEAQAEASRTKKEADRLADEVNILNRRVDNLQKFDPNHNTAGVRAFIKQQNINRLARAARLQNFIGGSGVNPKDLARELEVRSPIDAAMAGRKPPRGSQRPVLPSRR